MKYLFKKIEPKWQAKWEEAKVFEAKDNSDKPKFYGLVEFPYPSGAGMHVGHIKAYSSLEVISRKRRMEGYNVLFPIGFDAFGLPTENYAVKTGTHPRIITDENIKRFSNQLKKVGFSFDWNRVIDTTDEDYYKWTQWIFLKMFEKGLVFRDRTLVNYCPHCKVVLSNEDSQGGKCDICHSDVVQKSKDVWYLRITQYADKLLEGLKDVDYPDNVKQQQIHWIGKSKGAFVNFDVDGIDEKLEIYTTRPDTLFGVTFMVIAPEHPIIDKYADKITNMDEITAYRNECAKKTEFERTQLVKDKTGVRIQGLEGINPVNGKKIPIYIADYVMMGYGTGAIMAVPAHDQRDYDFAKKFGIDIIEVIKGGDISKEAYTGDGEMVNSDFLNGYAKKKDSIERMLEELEKNTTYTICQTGTAEDYAINPTEYTFNVTADGRIDGEAQKELNLTNRVIRVSIGAASNILGGQRAGVELSLYDASDNLIRTWTTTNAPVTFTDLEAGSYYVTMGENSEKHYTFQVVDQAAIQTVSVGASKTALYALIGGGVVVLLGIVITGVSALRKRKKKDRS